jgi:hypothetical protein
VIADSGELPSEEMLRSVTRPLEESIRRVPGVLQMRSTTSRGSTEINLDCEWRSDMDLALQRVQAQVNAIRSELPAGSTIDARLMNPVLFPVLGFSLTSETLSLVELRDFAVMVLRPELSRLPGAADVVVQGGRRVEARVTLDPAALQARGLDADDVAQALRQTDVVESVGLLDLNHELYLALTDAPTDLAELRRASHPDRKRASVSPAAGLDHAGDAPGTRYAAEDGETVLVNLRRQSAGSTIGLANATRKWFADHPEVLPAGVHMTTFYDQSDLVRSSLTSVRDSLLVGALLAVVVVVFFLASLHLGLAGATVLPGSWAHTPGPSDATVAQHDDFGRHRRGRRARLDDAIVVVGSFSQAIVCQPPRSALLKGETPRRGIEPVRSRPRRLLLGGVTGAFFRVLALARCSCDVLARLRVTVLPLLVRARPPPTAGARSVAALLLRARSRHPTFWSLGSGCRAGTRHLAVEPRSEWIPARDEGSDSGLRRSAARRSRRPSASCSVWRRDRPIPDIRAGRAEPEPTSFFITSRTRNYVQLADGRRAGADVIADRSCARIEATLPGVEVEFGQLIEDVIGIRPNPQPIEGVFGEDRRLFEEKALRASDIVAGVRGVVDVGRIVEAVPALPCHPR